MVRIYEPPRPILEVLATCPNQQRRSYVTRPPIHQIPNQVDAVASRLEQGQCVCREHSRGLRCGYSECRCVRENPNYGLSHKLSIFLIISLAHCTDAAINWSVRGLPCGPPKRSSAVRMCRLARIAAIMPITRLRPSSTRPFYNVRLFFATSHAN